VENNKALDMRVSVPERGAVDVPQDIWRRLAADPAMWTLVQDKVVIVEKRANHRVVLRGTCYVGRAVVGGVDLEFSEKFPGAFQALCAVGLPKGTKLAKAPSAVGDSPLSTALLVKVFIEAVESYVSHGREFAYMERYERGSLIGGKLKVAETIRLRARGVRHQAAFSRTTITTLTDLNLIICAALLRVETLSRLHMVDRSSVIAARSLTMVFAECQQAVVRMPPDALRNLAIQQAEMKQAEDAHIVELAAAILGEAGFGDARMVRGLVGRSWFVNLENMFERAVRAGLSNVLEQASVTSATKAPGVFADLMGRYPANTDIVIRAEGRVCIGDAKYKDRKPREFPDASEVQELLTHASAYSAMKAFLVFPSERAWEMRVGADRNGCEIWCFGVRLTNMVDDLITAAIALGYAPQIAA
jgi:hypothetical protein